MNVFFFSFDKQKIQLGYISPGTFFPFMFVYLILNNMQKIVKLNIQMNNTTDTIIFTSNFITCWYL